MTRLIDADALLERFKNAEFVGFDDNDMEEVITNAPTVQREGWVSVPIEPTKMMLEFMAANWGTSKHHAGSLTFAGETYKAMIQAAPTYTEK